MFYIREIIKKRPNIKALVWNLRNKIEYAFVDPNCIKEVAKNYDYYSK